jgi:hypothetical protein
MRSYVARTKIVVSIVPDQYTAATNGSGADLLGFDSNVIEVTTGAFGGTTPAASFKIQDSPDNSTFTDCADTVLDGITLNSAGVALVASSVQKVGYIGLKRYVRVILASVTGTTPIIRAGANVIRTDPKQVP